MFGGVNKLSPEVRVYEAWSTLPLAEEVVVEGLQRGSIVQESHLVHILNIQAPNFVRTP
jgi:hypothetical protein